MVWLLSIQYIADLLERYEPVGPLRSSGKGYQIISSVSTKMGESVFSFYPPSHWDTLPDHVKCATTLSTFKTKLNHSFLAVSFSSLISQFYFITSHFIFLILFAPLFLLYCTFIYCNTNQLLFFFLFYLLLSSTQYCSCSFCGSFRAAHCASTWNEMWYIN